MDLDVIKVFAGYGLAGLTLAALVWSEIRHEKIILKLFTMQNETATKTTEVLEKLRETIYQRLLDKG
jgi:hypothetical protein